MIYLLRPDMSVQWLDLPSQPFLDAATQDRVDLGRLDWKASEYQADQNTLPLALRHGVACSAGIVVSSDILLAADRPALLTTTHRDLRARTAGMAGNDEFMEKLMPGWKSHGEQLNARIQQSTEAFIAEAEQELAELLSADPKPELVAHWETVHGRDLYPSRP